MLIEKKMSNQNNKIIINIDGLDYKQIRFGNDYEMWKNVPLVTGSTFASGLHIVSGHPERNHYDFYWGKQPIEWLKEKTSEGVGGMMITGAANGNFAMPSNKIFVLTGTDGRPTFISEDIFLKNVNDYEVLLRNNQGLPCIVKYKKKDAN